MLEGKRICDAIFYLFLELESAEGLLAVGWVFSATACLQLEVSMEEDRVMMGGSSMVLDIEHVSNALARQVRRV